jgi:hypothetical protein
MTSPSPRSRPRLDVSLGTSGDAALSLQPALARRHDSVPGDASSASRSRSAPLATTRQLRAPRLR